MSSVPPSRVPVIVGAGQLVQRPGDLPLEQARGPIELMTEVARLAAADAGAPGLLERVGWLGVVPGWYRHYNPGALVAARLGLGDATTAAADSPSEPTTAIAGISGTAPQDLLGLACDHIAAGRLDVALVLGGEARWSQQRFKRLDQTPPWQVDDTGPTDGRRAPEAVSGIPDEMIEELDVLRSAAGAYALFDDRLRVAAGETPAVHAARIAELWASFSAVAAGNPYAWDRTLHTAADIVTPGPDNRMIAFPYPKAMVANNTVDMASALLVCSQEVAGSVGVSTDRFVFPHVVTHSHETWQVVARRELHQSPALEAAGRAAFARAGVLPDQIEHVDLYACFPAIVQMSAAALGLALPVPGGRPLTLTGGLGFAGAPIANSVGHSLAAMVSAVRGGGWALVHGNGGHATKQSFGIYADHPPAAGFADIDAQDQVDLRPRDVLPDDWEGACTVEAATLHFDRQGPERVVAAVLDQRGARGWATSRDPDLFDRLTSEGLAGLPAKRGGRGELLL